MVGFVVGMIAGAVGLMFLLIAMTSGKIQGKGPH